MLLQEADLLALFPTSTFDPYALLAVRDALIDIFTYCYLSSYTNCVRDTSTDFYVRVSSHLLTFSLAHRFEIAGLVALVEQRFREASVWYAENMEQEKVVQALQLCFSEEFARESGLVGGTLNLLRDTVLAVFKAVVERYKERSMWKEEGRFGHSGVNHEAGEVDGDGEDGSEDGDIEQADEDEEDEVDKGTGKQTYVTR